MITTIHYHPGKDRALPDTLSQFSPHPGPDILLDIAIHHAHLSPERKEAFQQAFVGNPKMCALADMIITGWPDDIKVVPCPLCPYWQHWETLTVKDGLVLCGEALIIPPSEWERILQQLHQFHQGTTKAQLFAHGCVFWPGINKAIDEAVQQCETCIWFQAQTAAAPLTPMPTPSHPWQMCATDIFTLEGINHLICGDFYSKMILIQHLPSGQSNAVKVVSLLKEMFSEHGIPKVLHSDNLSVCECTICWVLHLLGYHTWDLKPSLSTIEWIHQSVSNLWSMHSNMLSTMVLTTSLPFWCSELHPLMPSSCHLLSSYTNARLGPPFLPEFATLIWLPCRFVNELMTAPMPPSHRQTNDANPLHPCMLGSLLWCTTPSVRSGSLPLWYVSCMRWYPHEQSIIKPTDTTLNVTTATLQAPTRPHISATLHAPAKPAQLLQPPPVAPAMPVTPRPQTPAVLEVTPVSVPMSATPSIAPVQPCRLGHAHTTPKHLIEEL